MVRFSTTTSITQVQNLTFFDSSLLMCTVSKHQGEVILCSYLFFHLVPLSPASSLWFPAFLFSQHPAPLISHLTLRLFFLKLYSFVVSTLLYLVVPVSPKLHFPSISLPSLHESFHPAKSVCSVYALYFDCHPFLTSYSMTTYPLELS